MDCMGGSSNQRDPNWLGVFDDLAAGTVDKIIPALGSQPEKAQIAVQGAEALYREIRVDNKMQNVAGEDVRLKLGATVEVTIEAKPEATIPE
jgi:hypothetical protein